MTKHDIPLNLCFRTESVLGEFVFGVESERTVIVGLLFFHVDRSVRAVQARASKPFFCSDAAPFMNDDVSHRFLHANSVWGM